MKPFKEISEESQDELTKALFEGSNLLKQFVDVLSKMIEKNNSLIETTLRGSEYVAELHNICINLKKKNNRILEFVNDLTLNPLEADIRHLVTKINIIETPTVLSILKIIFEDNDYDEDDKQNVHKYCQIYDILLQQYKHSLYQVQLKRPNLRQYQINDLDMKKIKNYEASQDKINRIIGE
jgi:hypothetical protein